MDENKKRVTNLVINILILVSLVLIFLFGPLLPWSPVKIGYQKVEGNRYTLYYLNKYQEKSEYRDIDNILTEIQDTFGISYLRHIDLYVVDSAHMKLVLPFYGSGIGGGTLQTGNAVYINKEKVDANKYIEEQYIKHELVHILFHQNAGLVKSVLMNKPEPLREGFAVYYGGPEYFKENDFISRYQVGEYRISNGGNEMYEKLSYPDGVKINYMIYGKFVKYLYEEYEKEKVNEYIRRYISSPTNFRGVFLDVFEKDLKEVQIDFHENLERNTD